MKEDSMRNKRNFRKPLYTMGAAMGLALGSFGVAAAATGDTLPADAPAEDTIELQEPSYTGSIQAPAEDESLTEAEEAASLKGLDGIISADVAQAAALKAVPGTAGKVELDNENGSVVYSVEIADSAGAEVDVKVDAGNGAVLDQQANDGDEAAEADDDNVQHENEHEGENDADEGHED